MLRHAAVEAETEAFAEAGSQAQAQAQGDAVAASMKDAMLQAERSLAAARSASAGAGTRAGTQQDSATAQLLVPGGDRQFLMLRLATVLAQHLLPALASVSVASSSAHGDARAHALQLLVSAVVQLGQLTQAPEPTTPTPADKRGPCWRRRLARTVCTALEDGIIKDCCATLADFQPLPQVRAGGFNEQLCRPCFPVALAIIFCFCCARITLGLTHFFHSSFGLDCDQWCLRMYAFALRRWPSLKQQFSFDGAWAQENMTGEGAMCLEDMRIEGQFVGGVPSGKCTVTITRATEAKSFDFQFDDQH